MIIVGWIKGSAPIRTQPEQIRAFMDGTGYDFLNGCPPQYEADFTDMARSKKPSAEEIDLFRHNIGPIRKLRNDKAAPHTRGRSPRPGMPVAEVPHTPLPGFSDGQYTPEISAGDTLFYARPGLQQRLLQRLRRGQLRSEAELDMHGMTVAEAQNAVARFLSHCRDQQIRCARIIHGKGYGSRENAPVLKNRLNHWLRQHHDVLAFCSTRPEYGGTGAVNVLLRTRRQEPHHE